MVEFSTLLKPIFSVVSFFAKRRAERVNRQDMILNRLQQMYHALCDAAMLENGKQVYSKPEADYYFNTQYHLAVSRARSLALEVSQLMKAIYRDNPTLVQDFVEQHVANRCVTVKRDYDEILDLYRIITK